MPSAGTASRRRDSARGIDSGVHASLPGLSDAVLSGINLDDRGGDGRTDTDTDTDTKKGAGHGTAMAELIAGQGQDLGMVGVAPDAKILPIVAGRYSFQVAPAIRWAVDHGAKVINISEGSPDAYLGATARVTSSPLPSR